MKVRCAHDALVPLKDLKPHNRNRNDHPDSQIRQLAKMMEVQGVRRPIVVSNLSGLITAGHGRLAAAKLNGWKEFPVDFQDYDSEELEYADVQGDNAVALQAELDLSAIHKDLPELAPFDLELLGIKDFQLEPDPVGDPDACPAPPKIAKTKRGELWILGNHRLLIDDCTVKENVERLLGGEKADMVFTDPPYGVQYDPEWREKFCKQRGNEHDVKTKTSTKYMANDDDFDFSEVINEFDPTVVYVWHADKHTRAVYDGLLRHGLEPKQMIIWQKTMHVLSRTDYHYKHEPCWYAVKSGETHMWAGATDQTTIWEYPPMHSFANKEEHTGHACQKPVALMEHGIRNHTCKIVVDPFLGSGSTLIACEKTGRRCFGMEIEPLYGDVILDRFEKFSGKRAVREDGVTWQSLKTC